MPAHPGRAATPHANGRQRRRRRGEGRDRGRVAAQYFPPATTVLGFDQVHVDRHSGEVRAAAAAAVPVRATAGDTVAGARGARISYRLEGDRSARADGAPVAGQAPPQAAGGHPVSLRAHWPVLEESTRMGCVLPLLPY